MAELIWDQIGERYYETGVDHGVLYIPDEAGVYDDGVAWNGLVTVTESPTGAEANPQYADNIKYLNLYSAEEFGATIEAFTYPDEFAQFDGLAVPTAGVVVGQQTRKSFGLSYRTRVGNDLEAEDKGYKIHLIWGATASPSEKAYSTINDSPEAITFSWEVTTIPVAVEGLKPTAQIVIDSTKVSEGNLSALETILYGTIGTDPALPTPDEVLALFDGSVTAVIAPIAAPTIDTGTNIITIPSHTGIDYRINGDIVTGAQPAITEAVLVVATLKAGYSWPAGVFDQDWLFIPEDLDEDG